MLQVLKDFKNSMKEQMSKIYLKVYCFLFTAVTVLWDVYDLKLIVDKHISIMILMVISSLLLKEVESI